MTQCLARFQGRGRAFQLCHNNCRGLAAELGTTSVLRDRRYQVRPQVAPAGRRVGVMDLTSTRPRAGRIFHGESKHLDLSRHLTPSGQLNLTALQRFLLAELTPLGIAVTVIMPGSPASRAFEI